MSRGMGGSCAARSAAMRARAMAARPATAAMRVMRCSSKWRRTRSPAACRSGSSPGTGGRTIVGWRSGRTTAPDGPAPVGTSLPIPFDPSILPHRSGRGKLRAEVAAVGRPDEPGRSGRGGPSNSGAARLSWQPSRSSPRPGGDLRRFVELESPTDGLPHGGRGSTPTPTRRKDRDAQRPDQPGAQARLLATRVRGDLARRRVRAGRPSRYPPRRSPPTPRASKPAR